MITRFGDRPARLLMRLATLAFGTLAGSAMIALTQASPANAQAAYGSYIGIGPAFGDGEIGVAINGRYNILELPVSIRGAAFLGAPTKEYVARVGFLLGDGRWDGIGCWGDYLRHGN